MVDWYCFAFNFLRNNFLSVFAIVGNSAGEQAFHTVNTISMSELLWAEE